MKTVQRRKRVVKYVTVTKRIVTVEDEYVAFGKAVREMRRANFMTQEGLAKKTGLKRTSIVNIEVGRQRVLLGDLWVFAKGLGVTPIRLFNACRIVVDSGDTCANCNRVRSPKLGACCHIQRRAPPRLTG